MSGVGVALVFAGGLARLAGAAAQPAMTRLRRLAQAAPVARMALAPVATRRRRGAWPRRPDGAGDDGVSRARLEAAIRGGPTMRGAIRNLATQGIWTIARRDHVSVTMPVRLPVAPRLAGARPPRRAGLTIAWIGRGLGAASNGTMPAGMRRRRTRLPGHVTRTRRPGLSAAAAGGTVAAGPGAADPAGARSLARQPWPGMVASVGRALAPGVAAATPGRSLAPVETSPVPPAGSPRTAAWPHAAAPGLSGQLGNWLSEQLTEAAIRPPSGITGPNDRLTPVFAGMVGPG